VCPSQAAMAAFNCRAVPAYRLDSNRPSAEDEVTNEDDLVFQQMIQEQEVAFDVIND